MAQMAYQLYLVRCLQRIRQVVLRLSYGMMRDAGGCNSVFADGSVHYLGERIDGVTMRDLIARADGDVISSDNLPR